MRRLDISGKEFGRLTAVKYVGSDKNKLSVWECVCSCGNIIKTSLNQLKSGKTKSCGCIRKKHGLTNDRIYNIWKGIKARCFRKNATSFKYYGGLGISVCDEWKKDFISFYNWAMQNGYDNSLTIDRIDVNGNYEPSNCRWVTFEKQSSNKSSNRFFIIDNNKKCLSDWCKYYFMPYNTVKSRIRNGWDIKRALTTEIKRNIISKWED